MKYIIVILSTFNVLIYAQRPSFASSGPIGRPGLGSRFKENNSGSSTTDPSFENRVGETNSSTTTSKIPVDARGDVDLVNTLNSWDREHQPFWFINAEHIERQRNTTRTTPQPVQQNTSENSEIVNRNQFDSQTRNPSSISDVNLNYSGNQNGFSFTDLKPYPRPVTSQNDHHHNDWLYGRPAPNRVRYPEGTYQRNQESRQTVVDPYRYNRQFN